MKINVSQQQFAHGLGIVSRAVAARSTLPVLNNILLATDEGRLRLCATNLEVGISCWIGAQIVEDGSITVPARTLTDLVGTLPGDTVYLELNSQTQSLNVKCGSSSTDIKGLDAQEFPPMPIPELANAVDLNVADFREMILQVAFCASSDDSRPALQGVSVTLNDSEITMAATDGFRISVRKSALSNPVSQTISVIIPARALNELARIAGEGNAIIKMVIPQGRGQVIFHLPDVELASQLIDATFPDFKLIIPQSFKTRTIVPTSALLKACRQAEVIARDSNNVIRFNIENNENEPGRVEVQATSEETGASEIILDATIDGPGLPIAFNVRFLREVLDVIKTPNVVFETSSNNSPGVIRPVNDDNFLHVIMPMHLG
ncbi:MAG: DNA polymerase III subunit beta [Leptolinea sp.]